MKVFLSVDLYEDMIGQPFEVGDYLACCLSLFVQQNGEKKEICHSTFHDALLLDIGRILLEFKENNVSSSNTIETYENAMKYTLKKTDKLLLIKAYSEYDHTTETAFIGNFEEFFTAYFKGYELYFKDLLQQDLNANQHDSVEMMEKQLKTYKKLKNRY
jgi:hypothetical protein